MDRDESWMFPALPNGGGAQVDLANTTHTFSCIPHCYDSPFHSWTPIGYLGQASLPKAYISHHGRTTTVKVG